MEPTIFEWICFLERETTYVEVIILVNPKGKTNEVLESFSAFHFRLQSTLDVGHNDEILFWELLLLHPNDGQLKIK